MKLPPKVNEWSINVDKRYFISVGRKFKRTWKRNLVPLLAVIIILTLTLLAFDVKEISAVAWERSCGVVLAIAIILLWKRIVKNTKEKKDKPQNFDPVSLGTLWFSFALSLWIAQKTHVWYFIPTEIFFGLGAMAFLIAVFSRSMRVLINKEIPSFVMFLNFLAFVGGFILGWWPALSTFSGFTQDAIAYFGFFWVVVMLLVVFRDYKNKLSQILFIIFFFVGGFIKIFHHGAVNIIGGGILVGIAVLSYLLAVHRLHPYGEVTG